MTNTPITSAQSRDFNIDKCLITSNDGSNKRDISNLISDFYYYENILSETLKIDLIYGDTGKTVESDGKMKTLVDGLPLVGTEKVEVTISDTKGKKITLDMYVDIIKPLSQDKSRSIVSLSLVSKERIFNYKTVLNTRFDGKISDHVRKIITDSNFLGSKKTLDIEETENTYNFVGNNRRPFFAILWLAKKAIPKLPNAKGNTAGYFFFETSEGFKFKSIDGLLSETSPSGEKKQYKSLYYNDTPDERGKTIPQGYSGKVLKKDEGTVSGSAQSKLEIGTYSTRTILFDPFNCYYEIINPNAKGGNKASSKNLTKAGKELPGEKFNTDFDREGVNKDFTRTQYMLIDKGSLPTGDTSQQITKSKEKNFDPQNILNQSTMRYNQFFSSSNSITVTGDFDFHAGDLIFIDTPELSDKEDNDVNKQFGGFYVISELCHYLSILHGGYTKLTLVRDSLGRKGNPTIPL